MRRNANREERSGRLLSALAAALLLAFDMLAGRLELYPMLTLFAPPLWRKRINALHEVKAK